MASNRKSVTFAPGTRGVSATYTREGDCPSNGVHTPNGSIYIGSYSDGKCKSPAVRPHHSEIFEARKKGNLSHPSRNKQRRINAIKRQKRKLSELKTQIAAAKVKIAAASAAPKNDGDDKAQEDLAKDNAGDAFGGKRSNRN